MATLPAGEQAPLSGQILGHYHIHGTVGRGGMGRVYLASDDRLKRKVAIKSLRSRFATDPAARKRFLRGTRLACQIVHPYVATVFDVLEHGDELLLVMEYIEGRPLSRVIRDDRPDPSLVERWGLEIAEALSAIHEAGLVHRDLKPGNVMITPSGHVKVMDFDLVRTAPPSLEQATTRVVGTMDSTEEGGWVGTPLYMSPEQLRGKPLDQRSDLFSLGVLLYESLTGTHPFSRNTMEESRAAILHEPPGGDTRPDPLSDVGSLRDVTLRLMEKEPTSRYQSAEMVVADLRASLEERVPPSIRARSRRRLRRIAWVAATVALVAVAGKLIYDRWPAGGLEFEPRPVIAVMPFTDETGEVVDDLRGRMLASLLAADLGESKVVRPMGRDRLAEVLDALPGDASPSQRIEAVGNAADPDWYLAGSLFRDGESYLASVDVYRAGVAEPFGAFRVGAARLVGLVDLASIEFHALVAPDHTATADPEVAEAASSSEEALLLEFRARQAARALRYGEAIDLLEQAIAEDPRFILAHSALAGNLYRAGYGRRALESAEKAKRAVEGPGGPPTERIAGEVRATHARVHEDFAGEVEARRRLAELFPDEPDVLRKYAAALRRNAKRDEALSVIETAIALDPTDPRSLSKRAQILTSLERYDAATEAIAEAARSYEAIGSEGGAALMLELRGTILWYQGDFAAAQPLFLGAMEKYRAAGDPGNAAINEKNAADLAQRLGRFADAYAHYRSTLAVARQAGNSRLMLQALGNWGAGLFQQGRYEEAERLMRESLTEARRLENAELLLRPVLNLASLLTYTGRWGEGRTFAEEGLELARGRQDASNETMALTLLADCLSAQGELRQAELSYRDLAGILRRATNRSGELVSVLMRLADVLRSSADLGQALAVSDEAVEVAEPLSRKKLGYAGLNNARALTELGDLDAADEALDRAEEQIGSGSERLGDLAARVGLARAALAMQRGDWADAEARLREILDADESERSQNVLTQALAASSRLALARNDPLKAMREARRGLEQTGARAVDLTASRTLLAEAEAAGGRPRDAVATARRALDEAARMNAQLLVARAAAVLVSAPREVRPADAENIRDQGIRALEQLLETVPEDRRPAVRSRNDVRELIATLDPSALEAKEGSDGDGT